MPIIVTRPGVDEPFGPGFLISFSTDFIGPLTADSFWTFTLSAPPLEANISSRRLDGPVQSGSIIMYNGTDDQVSISLVTTESVTGQPGNLRAELSNTVTGFHEQTDVPVILDRQSGVATEVELFTATNVTRSSVGLTEDERAAVLQTNVGVIALASINPLDLVGDLASAITTSPPLGFGSLSGTYVLSGDGEMPDIGDILHTKLGIYFVATAIPAGLSHRHGQSEEYPARLVQWRTVHTVGGVQLVTEVLDFTTHGEMLRWRYGKPTRIEYSILPGVILAARWWQFP